MITCWNNLRPSPASIDVEYIFIIGPQGDQVKEYMEERHPDKKVHYVLQARCAANRTLSGRPGNVLGPMLMAFSDTLVETDFSFLSSETADGVAWVEGGIRTASVRRGRSGPAGLGDAPD